ncbi:transcriptional regulator with XRE-family HTH domain [Sphingomonas sp. SORGH_AS870]|uniref:helix-turn-helix domain-containing protein n=1 Tax=Sphingomonas sp. SORGH_AS_0870 TaxID=3041801 RepID=UPI00285BE9ED|nr:helix-turn-helix transcriptional regulator [Sphingomonas sp. SORGH_AS_0870]MDR6144975.1 transcriptional regulator with XRE-family HTH domain [Sphingomonas sp. SORGH_AS_0870]
MDDVTSKAAWLKAARDERGWSAATLARAIVETAASRGVEVNLTQQAVSYFENGHGKTVPPWFRWAEALLNDQDAFPPPAPTASNMLWVDVTIPLGSEEALTLMFEGMLAGLDLKASRAANARLLARKLPIALSGLRDLRVVSETRQDHRAAPEEAAADLATASPEPRP